jgi:hypothetical protein
MILYALKCKQGHEFNAWFANSGAFDTQQRRGLLVCPVCATRKVEKALMTPNVAKPAKPRAAKRRPVAAQGESASETQQQHGSAPETQRVAIHRELAAAVRKLRAQVEANSEYVGPRFCEEARKIHYEEAPARGIHGEATAEEAKALREDGIEFFPLPILPEEHN